MPGSGLDLQSWKSFSEFSHDGLILILGVPVRRLQNANTGVSAERTYTLTKFDDVVWEGAPIFGEPKKRERYV
jgi:hypothetical protein